MDFKNMECQVYADSKVVTICNKDVDDSESSVIGTVRLYNDGSAIVEDFIDLYDYSENELILFAKDYVNAMKSKLRQIAVGPNRQSFNDAKISTFEQYQECFATLALDD